MAKLNKFPLLIALSVLPITLIGGGCASELAAPNGVCSVDTTLDCTANPLPTGTPLDVGLVGYGCTGTARPDDNATYDDGVPSSTVCADRGTSADGKASFCCTPKNTNCAPDPHIPCLFPNESAFQCQGSSRPDAFNAALNCENGVRDGSYIDYCCSGQPDPASCTPFQSKTQCGDVLQGFNCPAGILPKNEDLGANESRADYFRFLCPTALPTPSGKVFQYCCYMPAPPMDGFSCVQDTTVPGCAGGRFGFACYGFDTPHDDYPPMKCADKGSPGKSAEGYPATLFCCDFDESVAQSL